MKILTISDLNFTYGKEMVLKDINLSLESGDIVGLVGDNGSGKTTLMKLISGILPNYAGKIEVHSKSIGVLIEEPSLYADMSVLSNLQFYCNLYNKNYSIIGEYKDILDVDAYLRKKVSKLSLGMKQRIGLFVALIASDEFILLDEPTNGLDPSGISSLLNLIKKLSIERGITFIVSSHILENLEKICNKNILIRNNTLKMLNSDGNTKYIIYSPEISQNDLIKILDANGYRFEKNNRDIIISDLEIVEEFLRSQNITIQKEKMSLSEVFFDE